MKKNKEDHHCTRNMKHTQAQIDVRSVVIHNMLMVLDVQLVGTNAQIVIYMVIYMVIYIWSVIYMVSRHQCTNCHIYGHFSTTRKGLWSQDHPKHINFRLVQFICKIPYAASQKTALVKIHSDCKCN